MLIDPGHGRMSSLSPVQTAAEQVLMALTWPPHKVVEVCEVIGVHEHGTRYRIRKRGTNEQSAKWSRLRQMPARLTEKNEQRSQGRKYVS